MELREDELESTESPELTDYIRVIRERWWVIVAALVIVVVLTVVLSLVSTPQYRSEARLLYQKTNLDQALFGSQILSTSDQNRAVQTGAELVELKPVAEAVISQLGTSRSVSALLQMVSVRADTSTNVVSVEAVSTDATESADVANAFADQFVLSRAAADKAVVASAREVVKEQLDTLSAADTASDYGLMLKEKYETLRILESMQNGGFTVVERATTPADPFSPQPVRNAIIAFVAGLVLGTALAFLLDCLDRRIKDEKTIEKELGAPVLASVPTVGGRWGGKNGDRVASTVGFVQHPALLESFRTLRSSLQYFGLDKEHPVWLITSALPEEGKTTTIVNLGLSLALSGKRVIVLEADLRRPALHKYLGVNQGPGLSNVLAGTSKLGDALQLVKADEFVPSEGRRRQGEARGELLQRNFYALTSGPLPPNPAELLASDRMTKVIEELSHMTDCLLIDSPPVVLVSDALTVAPRTDGVILTTLLGATTRDELHQMRTIFERAGTRVIGAVAGGRKESSAFYHKGAYGYGTYGYGKYGYGYGHEGE
jgi:capsular polysaccharide biosynthesis protein/Mrp family chromosome partitioning ATPase